MKDKVQKIREEVEKRYDYWKEKESNSHSIESEIRMSECQHLLLMLNSLQGESTIPDIVDEHYWEMLGKEPQEHANNDFEKALEEMIDKAQKCAVEPIVVAQQWKDYLIGLAKSEEPVKDRFAFKAIPRLLDMIEPTDKAKSYVTKLADAFDSEGYYTDAKIVRESLKIMNGEKVAMATMDEEPVSEELEKIVEEITEPTVLNAYGTKELARRLRNTVIYGTSVSNELDEMAELYTLDDSIKPWKNLTKEAFKAGAKWQKLQDMGITNKAQDVVANVLSSADNPLDAYATEVAFMMLPATLKESYHQTNRDRIGDAVKLGAKWQKEKDDEEKVLTYKHGFEDCKEQMMKNIWKPDDGDDFPIFDREVIALLNNGKVVFAHRPNPEGWDAKSIITEKVEHYIPETYGKGGWNQPDIRWWLDTELPKEIEL